MTHPESLTTANRVSGWYCSTMCSGRRTLFFGDIVFPDSSSTGVSTMSVSSTSGANACPSSYSRAILFGILTRRLLPIRRISGITLMPCAFLVFPRMGLNTFHRVDFPGSEFTAVKFPYWSRRAGDSCRGLGDLLSNRYHHGGVLLPGVKVESVHVQCSMFQRFPISERLSQAARLVTPGVVADPLIIQDFRWF
jgi:hypothetical protein